MRRKINWTAGCLAGLVGFIIMLAVVTRNKEETIPAASGDSKKPPEITSPLARAMPTAPELYRRMCQAYREATAYSDQCEIIRFSGDNANSIPEETLRISNYFTFRRREGQTGFPQSGLIQYRWARGLEETFVDGSREILCVKVQHQRIRPCRDGQSPPLSPKADLLSSWTQTVSQNKIPVQLALLMGLANSSVEPAGSIVPINIDGRECGIVTIEESQWRFYFSIDLDRGQLQRLDLQPVRPTYGTPERFAFSGASFESVDDTSLLFKPGPHQKLMTSDEWLVFDFSDVGSGD